MDDAYAIGNADHFDVISGFGVVRIEYDIAQAQTEDCIKYDIPDMENDGLRTISDVQLGDSISITIADDILDRDALYPVYGFIVPEHLLPQFIPQYPSLEIYPD